MTLTQEQRLKIAIERHDVMLHDLMGKFDVELVSVLKSNVVIYIDELYPRVSDEAKALAFRYACDTMFARTIEDVEENKAT